MNVRAAYGQAWAGRRFLVPLLLGVRLLSLAVIAPLLGLAVQFATKISGQSALTDQDIAWFILSPAGFPVFLLVAALILLGTVIGFAVITISLRYPDSAATTTALAQALRRTARRFAHLMRYATGLILRILVISGPFVIAGMLVARHLIGAYDINYYLTYRPSEFIWAVITGGALAAVLVPLLLSRLLSWAVSLHFVLLGHSRAREAFVQSREDMRTKRRGLLRDLLVWYAIRAGAHFFVGVGFVAVLRLMLSVPEGNFELRLGLAVLITSLWAVTAFVITAISLGALARIIDARYEGPVQATTGGEALTPAGLSLPALCAVGIGAVVVIGGFTAMTLFEGVKSDQDVLVIAHRGAAGSHPENTLAALQAAVDAGADWVEIDVQETAEGDVVVMHDSDFMKLAQVDLKIWNATAEDLDDIDIGSWFDPAYSDQRVPRLSDALEVTRGKARLLIELKYYGHDQALEERTAAVVDAADMNDQVAFMSLKYPAVGKMAALRPDWPSGVLAATAVGDLSGLDADFIAVNTGLVTPRLVRNAAQQGKKVFVWTVNDPLDMLAMVSLGVDGLITDEPALARAALQRHAGLETHERAFLVFLEHFGLTDSLLDDSEMRP